MCIQILSFPVGDLNLPSELGLNINSHHDDVA